MAGIGGNALTSVGRTNDWITPKEVIDELGPFDLDPCQSMTQPWPCATRGYTLEDDGLNEDWSGRVWLNPPYGKYVGLWLNRLSAHQYGTALVFARTETKWFQLTVWPTASAILFVYGRFWFLRPDGSKHDNAGGPSVLVAYGHYDRTRLEECAIPGKFIDLWGGESARSRQG